MLCLVHYLAARAPYLWPAAAAGGWGTAMKIIRWSKDGGLESRPAQPSEVDDFNAVNMHVCVEPPASQNQYKLSRDSNWHCNA